MYLSFLKIKVAQKAFLYFTLASYMNVERLFFKPYSTSAKVDVFFPIFGKKPYLKKCETWVSKFYGYSLHIVVNSFLKNNFNQKYNFFEKKLAKKPK